MKNTEDHEEIRRVVPSKEYLDPECRWAIQEMSLRSTMLAVNPFDDSVAVAFNTLRDVRVFVYDSDLSEKVAEWCFPRYVQHLCWSPDGTKLAVLFNGHFDESKKKVSVYFKETVAQPDVWLLDAHSGEAIAKFSTGSNQARIAFNHDASLLYAINDYLYFGKGVLRAFSLPSGVVVQTFTGLKSGVQGNFLVSPNGKLIVADASKDWRPWYSLEYGQKKARFVVFDAATTRPLLQYEKLAAGSTYEPLPFAFSEDGKQLFVEYPWHRDCDCIQFGIFALE